MRRMIVVAGLALAVLMTTGHLLGMGAAAATATPTAGIEKDALGQVMSEVAPDRVLLLQKRVFAPGSDSGAHPAPGPVVLYVESGSITFSVVQGAATVTTYESSDEQYLAAGQSATLEAGDTVTYDQDVVHDVANPGREPAVTLEARLNPAPVATPVP